MTSTPRSGRPFPAVQHLIGTALPDLWLPSTSGSDVCLAELTNAVIFCHPRIGDGLAEPPGGAEAWGLLPGARGCTVQASSFRDVAASIRASGFDIFGMSTQPSDEQFELVDRLHLGYDLLSDLDLEASRMMGLPTFVHADHVYLERLTMICRRGVVAHALYPVPDPGANAMAVVSWLFDSREDLQED